MKCLVTGAMGFLGSAICKELIKRNHFVVGLDKVPNDGTFEIGSKFQFLCADMLIWNPDDLKRVLKTVLGVDIYDFDAIYHMTSPCSLIEFKEDLDGATYKSILGLNSVIEIAKSIPDVRVFLPSSGNVYGNIPIPQSETDAIEPNNPYAHTKSIMEILLKKSGVNYTIFRIFLGYGIGEEKKGRLSSIVNKFVDTAIQGLPIEIWGSGTQLRDLIYEDDISRLCVNALEKKDTVNQIFNIGTGRSLNFIEIAYLIKEALGKDTIDLKFADAPENYVVGAVANTEKMRKYLGNPEITAEEGIKRVVEHKLKKMGKL